MTCSAAPNQRSQTGREAIGSGSYGRPLRDGITPRRPAPLTQEAATKLAWFKSLYIDKVLRAPIKFIDVDNYHGCRRQCGNHRRLALCHFCQAARCGTRYVSSMATSVPTPRLARMAGSRPLFTKDETAAPSQLRAFEIILQAPSFLRYSGFVCLPPGGFAPEARDSRSFPAARSLSCPP